VIFAVAVVLSLFVVLVAVVGSVDLHCISLC
jgi:hypothetical protein